MPYNVEWFQEGKVIIVRIGVNFPIEEVAQLSVKLIPMLEQGTAPVHILIDATQVKTFPTNLIQARNDAAYFNHPSLGWNAYYGTPTIIHSLLKVFSSVIQAQIVSFRTYEQALAFLREKDDTVNLDG